jgi:hypothetical protein
MASRQTLPEQARMKRDALLQALRKPGDHTDLVAQRARALLQWTPQGADREAWLRGVLPEGWHTEETLKALRATACPPTQANGTNGAAQRPAAQPVGRRQARTRQRHGAR